MVGIMEIVRRYGNRGSLAPSVGVWGLENGGRGEVGLRYLIHLLQNDSHPCNIADCVVELSRLLDEVAVHDLG